MFVLDTNVVSELMRPAPEPAIEAWLVDRPTSSLFITAISEAELRFGVAVMPLGKRRDVLAEGLERMLTTGFADRVLPFDSAAAQDYADMAATRRAAGRPISQADCQIAAIARSRGLAVATRNVRDFQDIGVSLVDPWNRTQVAGSPRTRDD